MSSIIGMTALATEVGNWYLVQRRAQNAADAAAFAAAKSLADGNSAATAQTIGLDVVSRNGFPNGGANEVSVAPTTSPQAVLVTVKQTQALLLSRLMMSSPPKVPAYARAVVDTTSGGACVLALSGSIGIGNNIQVNAPGCALASNYQGTNAFQAGSGQSIANGTFTVTASTIVTRGGCNGCLEATQTKPPKLNLLNRPPSTYQPPIKNPYQALNTFRQPPQSSFPKPCINAQQDTTLLPFETNSTCYSSISLSGSGTTYMSAGTYYIRGGDFKITSGSLLCSDCSAGKGVTIVLTGDKNNKIGLVSINTTGEVTLSAPQSNPALTNKSNSDLSGVLIFRDPDPTLSSSGGSTQVTINGGAKITLNGAIVAPNAPTSLSGNSTNQTTGCTVMVVASLSLDGTSGVTSNLSTGGCTTTGTAVPTPQIIRLVSYP